jgi:hypothetical protein
MKKLNVRKTFAILGALLTCGMAIGFISIVPNAA